MASVDPSMFDKNSSQILLSEKNDGGLLLPIAEDQNFEECTPQTANFPGATPSSNLGVRKRSSNGSDSNFFGLSTTEKVKDARPKSKFRQPLGPSNSFGGHLDALKLSKTTS